jgi:hypothetical protein
MVYHVFVTDYWVSVSVFQVFVIVFHDEVRVNSDIVPKDHVLVTVFRVFVIVFRVRSRVLG